MTKEIFDFIDVGELRAGLYVDLNVGWLAHPFASSAFKITTEKQIQQLRALGLQRIRYVPAKSDPVVAALEGASAEDSKQAAAGAATAAAELDPHTRALAEQNRSLERCEQWFGQSVQAYGQMMAQIDSHPEPAVAQGQQLVQSLVGDLLSSQDAAIRLLTSVAGDRAAMHPVNVTVLSLLLGRALSLSATALAELGMAALLHDLGKQKLPERVRSVEAGLSATEVRMYQSHAAMGADWARALGLSDAVVQTIAHHHELADGSGFPAGLKQNQLSTQAQILALTNRYDGLCNPARLSAALTPHEALSMLFAQQKARFEPRVLAAFIRLMGVYPPGSVVQLVDDRYAMVVSVNSLRPLKPRVVVHEPGVPRKEALLLDLDSVPHMGIRRSFKPSVLPAAAHEYLAPKPRSCYYWESGVPGGGDVQRQAA